MAKKKIADLTLMKKLLEEMEQAMAVAEGMREKRGDINEFIVQLARCSGYAVGISQEASMLLGDFAAATKSPSSSEDLLSKLLDGLKPPTNAN